MIWTMITWLAVPCISCFAELGGSGQVGGTERERWYCIISLEKLGLGFSSKRGLEIEREHEEKEIMYYIQFKPAS